MMIISKNTNTIQINLILQVVYSIVLACIVLTTFCFITAWTDFERVPRSTWAGDTTILNEHDHGGSRKRLLMTRQAKLRNETQDKLVTLETLRPKSGSPLRRINLISDIRVENS